MTRETDPPGMADCDIALVVRRQHDNAQSTVFRCNGETVSRYEKARSVAVFFNALALV